MAAIENRALRAREVARNKQQGHITPFRPPTDAGSTATIPRRSIMQSESSESDVRQDPRISLTASQTPSSMPTTRLSRRLQDKETVEEPQAPERWTEAHGLPKWDSPLVYPAEGPKRTTVEALDIERLDDGEFLNDNLISFCLRQLEESHPELKGQVHMFNTFFYTALSTKQGRKAFNYDAVKRWTKNIDIFTYPFVVIPVNANLHWFVTVICNLDKLPRRLAGDEVDDEEDELANDREDMLDNVIAQLGAPHAELPMELPDSQEEQQAEHVREEVGRMSLSESDVPPSSQAAEAYENSEAEATFPRKSTLASARKGKKRMAPPLPKLKANQ